MLLWWAVDHALGAVIAFWSGTREHHYLDKLQALLSPLNIGTVYTDGNYAYFERFSLEVLVVSKRNTHKIERMVRLFSKFVSGLITAIF
jgi:IS1 family transposase